MYLSRPNHWRCIHCLSPIWYSCYYYIKLDWFEGNLYLKLFSTEPMYYPCNPSPCGPNSICREIKQQAVCTCVNGYLGSPPSCRPECIQDLECPPSQACTNKKCINPCTGACGIRSECKVINHKPVCFCPPGHTGSPYALCIMSKKFTFSKYPTHIFLDI